MKNIYIIGMMAILTIGLCSCEETIQLDLEQTEPVLVIEGLVTNKPGYNYVKLSKTSPFYASGSAPLVSGAQVEVMDGKGQLFVFEEVESGWYQPGEDFVGTIGENYTLSVKVEGALHTASEIMAPVNPFDSLVYWQPPGLDDDEALENDQLYELLVYYTEPQDQENYYLFKFYRNDELIDFNGSAVFVYDDESIAENIDGLATPEYYAKGDTGKMEAFGLSRKAYRYYVDLSNNINSDGGMFSGIPANPGTNLVGGTVGYFQVSAMESVEVVIGE